MLSVTISVCYIPSIFALFPEIPEVAKGIWADIKTEYYAQLLFVYLWTYCNCNFTEHHMNMDSRVRTVITVPLHLSN